MFPIVDVLRGCATQPVLLQSELVETLPAIMRFSAAIWWAVVCVTPTPATLVSSETLPKDEPLVRPAASWDMAPAIPQRKGSFLLLERAGELDAAWSFRDRIDETIDARL